MQSVLIGISQSCLMPTSFYSIHLKQLQSVDETVSKLITSRVMIVLRAVPLSKYEMIKYQAIELLRLQ